MKKNESPQRKLLANGGQILYWIAFAYCVVLGKGVPQWLKTLAWVGAGFFVVRMVWSIVTTRTQKKKNRGKTTY